MEKACKYSAKRITYLAVLLALALALHGLERLIPVLVPAIPGFKLGLANIVTLIVMVAFSFKDSLIIMVLRVGIFTLIAGSPISGIYSLCGGVLSCCGMGFCIRLFRSRIHLVTVSVFGAALHNLGQLCIAALLLQTPGIFSYFPVLMIFSIPTGILVGVCAQGCLRLLYRVPSIAKTLRPVEHMADMPGLNKQGDAHGHCGRS